jgi:hypothetical protein
MANQMSILMKIIVTFINYYLRMKNVTKKLFEFVANRLE